MKQSIAYKTHFMLIHSRSMVTFYNSSNTKKPIFSGGIKKEISD